MVPGKAKDYRINTSSQTCKQAPAKATTSLFLFPHRYDQGCTPIPSTMVRCPSSPTPTPTRHPSSLLGSTPAEASIEHRPLMAVPADPQGPSHSRHLPCRQWAPPAGITARRGFSPTTTLPRPSTLGTGLVVPLVGTTTTTLRPRRRTQRTATWRVAPGACHTPGTLRRPHCSTRRG